VKPNTSTTLVSGLTATRFSQPSIEKQFRNKKIPIIEK